MCCWRNTKNDNRKRFLVLVKKINKKDNYWKVRNEVTGIIGIIYFGIMDTWESNIRAKF